MPCRPAVRCVQSQHPVALTLCVGGHRHRAGHPALAAGLQSVAAGSQHVEDVAFFVPSTAVAMGLMAEIWPPAQLTIGLTW